MAGKAVTSLTTGPENPRRRVDPPYARPAKTASLRATDDCGGCDRARLVYVGWGGTSTAPTASPVEGWIAFDRMSGATNFKGEYLGTIIANVGGTGQQRLPIPKGWPCSRLGRSGSRGDPLAQPALAQRGDAGGEQRGGGGQKRRSRAGCVRGQAAGRGPGGEADSGGGVEPGESLGQPAWGSSRSVRVKPAISAGETVHPAARATAAICGMVPAAGNKNVPAARAARAAVNRRWAGASQSRAPYHSPASGLPAADTARSGPARARAPRAVAKATITTSRAPKITPVSANTPASTRRPGAAIARGPPRRPERLGAGSIRRRAANHRVPAVTSPAAPDRK